MNGSVQSKSKKDGRHTSFQSWLCCIRKPRKKTKNSNVPEIWPPAEGQQNQDDPSNNTSSSTTPVIANPSSERTENINPPNNVSLIFKAIGHY